LDVDEGAREEVGAKPMVGTQEEVTSKVPIRVLGEGGGALNVEEDVRGEKVPPPQVPSINSLLDDIYKLRYQVSQFNARMYYYQAKRDRYH